jgi:hypothetical protein
MKKQTYLGHLDLLSLFILVAQLVPVGGSFSSFGCGGVFWW